MFEEEPIWYPIYSNEFEKSATLLADLDEFEEDYYIDENGVKRRRKGFNLRDLEISEISLCGAGKVNAKYLIRKGDDEMEKSDFKWSDNCQRIIRGFSDSDVLEVSEEDLEIEKSSDTNPFPSLARIFSKNVQDIEEFVESENLEERFV